LNMSPEAIIRVRFLTNDEGGRTTPISHGPYGCPLMVNGKGHDCRFIMEQDSHYELGKIYEIPVKFLNPTLALKDITEGIEISLWEGKTIGIGSILKIVSQ